MKWIYLIFMFSILACVPEKTKPALEEQLDSYITENAEFPLVKDSLIACAAGGEDVLVNDEAFPISILFYPKEGASDFLYFESNQADIDPNDYKNYQLQDLEDAPILNGYLRKFRRTAINKNVWGLVTYFRNGEIHISNPIRIKYFDKPTENNSNLLTFDDSETLMPQFFWQDGAIVENSIYFQVIQDEQGDLLSGTYTFEKKFQFYDLSNVVLNIRDVEPAPTLVQGGKYKFIMMGVSTDNWVNLVMEKEFLAQ